MKKFLGFTPQQQYALLSQLGYKGPAQQDDMDKFIFSSPKAAAKMGHWALAAQKRLDKQRLKDG